ncbi:hypothetical protein SAMN05216428_1043 [Nitrosospira sp. Nsp11]|uniref:hypothetical protein n=1 Tax=Nitrosospira sp. Nsp11 TaxID=1855338 RepID=UPI00091E76B8|nr:hypothetical protein [Nitrosospira sp. Nsp11]SHL59078.1 hypothetical protein SAMN05216428_1043 [Nitrosospira sp. Nsp11]
MVEATDAKLRVSGGLTTTFLHCDTCLSDENFDRLRRMEFTQKENHIHHGQISGSVAGVIERNSVANTGQSRHAEERNSKERRTAQFVELLEQIRASIKQMESDVKALVASFEKRDGDAWREKLALDILGADDIPQQRSGENINAYRKRLEQHLINEMLNSDGTIKDRYKNDAKYGDYADWAQKQFHLNSARAVVAELDDDNTGPQRKEQLLDEMKQRGYFEEMTFADRTTQSNETQASMRDLADNRRDEVLSQARSSEAALKFLS